MKRFCIIGDPVEHSRSPELYQAMFAYLGLDWVYIKQRVQHADCARFLAQAKQGSFDGFNATMPHKETLAALVDSCTPIAQRIGSVNTVRIDGARAIGHSTDGDGLLGALDELGAPWRGETVCLIGAGGAAAAAAAALLQEGAAQLYLCNRTLESAQALAQRVGGAITVRPLSELSEAAAQSAVLVNASSLGMEQSAPFQSLDFLKAMKQGAAIYDMVYAPSPTALTQAARERHFLTANGEAMLLHQAVSAMEFYYGSPLDRPAISRWLHQHLARP